MMKKIIESKEEIGYIFYLFLAFVFLLPLERIGSFNFNGINIRFSQILILIIFFIYLIFSFYKKNIKVNLPPSLVFYILFLSFSLLSLINAYDKNRGIMLLLFLFFMVLVPYLSVTLINCKEKLKKVIYIFILSAVIASLFGIFQFLGDFIGLSSSITGISSRYAKEVLGFPRIQSTFIEPLYFANYLLIPLILSYFFLFKKIDPKKNMFFILSFLLFLICIFLTFSKGAALSIFIILLGLVLFQLRSILNKNNIKYLLLIIIFIISISWGAFNILRSKPDFEKVYTKAYNIITGASITERQEAYLIALEAFENNPVLGIGVGGFGPYFSGYPIHPPDFGWSIVNNQYLEVLAENGILGFVSFMIFLISIFYYSIFAYRKTRDIFLRNILLALNFAFLGVLIQYMTFSTLYIMHIWFLIGLILATQNLALKNKYDK